MFNSIVFEKAVSVIDSEFAKCELGCNVLDKRFKYVCQRAYEKIDSIISDLWSASRIGLIGEDCVCGTIDEINAYVKKVRHIYIFAFEKVVGKEEYEILHTMSAFGMSREEAIKWIAETEA